jgi:serine/threonine protein kinase/formylglycine-generating enzyme required for sulfatase activity
VAADPRPEPGAEERARSVLSEHLFALGPGASPEVESLCRQHPELARELRSMAEAWLGLGRVSLTARLRAALGEEVDPGVSLQGSGPESAADSGHSSELLRRLRAHAPASSRYRILGEIGRGGMGAVLRVWDEDLRRPSAMKVVLGKDAESSADAVEMRTLGRFLEEAQVTGQLDHPGIVPVHELGLDHDGRVYFTMRLVKGDDLRVIYERVRTGVDGWNPTRALGVLLKVCEAMAYAHDKGVLHRDLKPANVMVGKYGEAYVMDWGLARVLGQQDRHDLHLRPLAPSTQSVVRTERGAERHETPDSPLVTMDGAVVGTPAYMPPEQARGELEALGPHSDVYSMGAMLYELLAGHMPFVPGGARVSPHAVLMRVLEGPPRPLSELAPRAPAELVAIAEKAMAREPARRYRDMTALAKDLRAYLEHRVVQAHATGTWAETRKWVQRNRPLAASLAGILLVLAAGVVTSTLYARRADAARSEVADKNVELAESNRELLARERESRIRGLIHELEYFDSLDDDVYAYARRQTRPAHEWWIEGAELLVEGRAADPPRGIAWSPGLADVQDQLARVRARARAATEAEVAADRAGHPRAQELEAKRAELLWLSRLLGLETWPVESPRPTTDDEESLDASKLNSRAWALVDPDSRVFGRELEAVDLARSAVAGAPDGKRAECRDTLAWALLWAGKIDEALAEEARAVQEVGSDHRAEYEGYLARMEAVARSFRDGTAAERGEALAPEIAKLEQLVSEARTYRFEKSQDEWWHRQLVRLEEGLVQLRERLDVARMSVHSPESAALWSEAIAAITTSPHYGGLRLTPQLGLVPIGPDPATGLWEFAHLATGEPARRGAEGKIVLEPEMGVVLVLLPGGRVPVADSADQKQSEQLTRIDLDPFFLSKYEMTEGQWNRIGGRQRGRGEVAESLLPAKDLLWDDCQMALVRGGWLRLPSEAQWEYGCRAGTTTPWWTGSDAESLKWAAHIGTGGVQPTGQLLPNPFGLHDVHGNLCEWCGDAFLARGGRQGDGLRDEPGVGYRPCRGGASSSGAGSARSSQVRGGPPDNRFGDVGLRPARDITP